MSVQANAYTADHRKRLRTRAAALGMLNEVEAPQVNDLERTQILASTRGLGQVIDRVIDEDRDRLS